VCMRGMHDAMDKVRQHMDARIQSEDEYGAVRQTCTFVGVWQKMNCIAVNSFRSSGSTFIPVK
jgi:hypothetical protein